MSQPSQTRINQYSAPVDANGPKGISPTNPRRNYLCIQNTGANPLFVGFDKQDNGYTVYGGEEKEWDQIIPIDSINLRSPAGTTVVILEGMPV